MNEVLREAEAAFLGLQISQLAHDNGDEFGINALKCSSQIDRFSAHLSGPPVP
jgi:hypothetical protein